MEIQGNKTTPKLLDKFLIMLASLVFLLAGSGIASYGSVKTELWHLDAIDDSRFIQDGKFAPRFKNSIPNSPTLTQEDATQSPLVIYVVDSGVNEEHSNFENLAIEEIDLTKDADTENANVDCQDHGTPVASTIVGTRGVIPASENVKLVSVKVLACSQEEGANSQIGKALEWIWLNHEEGSRGIVNVSMSSEYTGGAIRDESLISTAIDSLRMRGIVVVASAGNNSTDACKIDPAGTKNTLTVGALSYEYISSKKSKITPAKFSNHGDCVDVWSFGEQIEMPNKDGDLYLWSGTSFSSPLVAGMLARYALHYNLNAVEAETLLLKNTKNYTYGKKRAIMRVPFFRHSVPVEVPKFTKPFQGDIAQFGPDVLAIEINRFLDPSKIRIEYFENGVLSNKVTKIRYAEGYYADVLALELSSPHNNASVKIYDTSGEVEVLLGDISN